ncbi:hypothetical protein ACFE04_027810 [Oxalis oulophora]
MCVGIKKLNSEPAHEGSAMDNPTGSVKFLPSLEFAASNDVEGFKQLLCDTSAGNEVGLWYSRDLVTKKMVVEHRTPLMVAAKYGSLDVLKYVISLSDVDVNFACGPDKSTALHCAVSSGSEKAIEQVKILLLAGADPNVTDANGYRPIDVIVSPLKHSEMKSPLEELLKNPDSVSKQDPLVSMISKTSDVNVSLAPEKKEYPVDPSFPDIKSSIYSTDEFRMFSFKIKPCSRGYSHDWTDCPFVHPGENARRRDPLRFHYSCMPCPDFRKGECKREESCEYAHGVFESWLHPAQYRTRLCKEGAQCSRQVCFFAHRPDELRPLYVSTGSGMPYAQPPTMDMALALNMYPGSPMSASSVPAHPFSPPASPLANGISRSFGGPQQNNPSLNLLGGNILTSRLSSSLNARDIDQQLLDDFSRFSQSHAQFGSPSPNFPAHSKTMGPTSNLDERFCTEVPSPRFSHQNAAFSSQKAGIFKPLQQQSTLSPIKTNNAFSPKHMWNASLGIPSPGMMSPRKIMDPVSPMSYRLPALGQKQQQQQFHSLSKQEHGCRQISRDPSFNSVVGSPVKKCWPNGELNNVKMESLSRALPHVEDPDISWVPNLVMESSPLVGRTTTVRASNGVLSNADANSKPRVMMI